MLLVVSLIWMQGQSVTHGQYNNMPITVLLVAAQANDIVCSGYIFYFIFYIFYESAHAYNIVHRMEENNNSNS